MKEKLKRRSSRALVIGGKTIKEIIISDKDDGLLVSITDDDVISHDDVKITMVDGD